MIQYLHIIPEINSFWIRIIALGFSFFWSLAQFIKNRYWNTPAHYIILFVNACLIFINAAGMNSISKQSPFEGYGVTFNFDSIKNRQKRAGIFPFPLEKQQDWFPDYKMLISCVFNSRNLLSILHCSSYPAYREGQLLLLRN